MVTSTCTVLRRKKRRRAGTVTLVSAFLPGTEDASEALLLATSPTPKGHRPLPSEIRNGPFSPVLLSVRRYPVACTGPTRGTDCRLPAYIDL